MGGFINGIRERQPGLMITCGMCKKTFHESNFNWSDSKGYYTYCYSCHQIRLRESRKKRKEVADPEVKISAPRNRADRLEVAEAMAYRKKLERTVSDLKVGDKVGGGVVEGIYPAFVILRFYMSKGRTETKTYMWDDIYKMRQGEIKGDEEYDE